jgi:Domain of unknown function (DUF4129)
MSPGAWAALGAARAGIEFCWRFAWAFFLVSLAAPRGFSAVAAAAALSVSGLLRWLAARRNWRLLPALLLRLAAFAGCAAFAVRRIWPTGLPPWYLLALAVGCLWLLWDGGRAAARDPEAPVPLDRGIGLFLLLELIRLVVRIKGGRLPEDPTASWLLTGLFVSGLAAIGLQRTGAGGQGLRARFGIGLLTALAVPIFLLLPVLALRCYEQLAGVADFLLPALGAAARPVGRAVTAVLLFWFSPKSLRAVGADARASGGPSVGGALAPAAGGPTLAQILGLGLTFLVALLGVAVLAVLVFQAVRWVLKRFGRRPGRDAGRLRLSALLEALLRLPAHLWSGLAGWLKGFDRAAAVYGALLRWGSRSGLPASSGETPFEYGARVAACFPPLAREVRLIVEGFHDEVYGERVTAPDALCRLRAARRRLLGPRHWPVRLRFLLFG